MTTTTHPVSATQNDGIGLPGQAVLALTLAGAVGLGGFLVAVMTLAGRLSGGGLMLSSTGLFLIGSFLGGLHGLVLGYIGREPGTGARRALLSEARSLLYAMPALAVAWPFTTWIAMTVVSRYTGDLAPLALSTLSWLGGLLLVAWAASVSWSAMRNAWGRWPERRVGTVVVGGSFVALGVLLLVGEPALWGQRLRLTPVGAGLVAAAAALWVVGPLLTLGLRAAHHMQVGLPQWAGQARSLDSSNVVLGVVSGLAVALLVLPFHRDPAMYGGVATGVATLAVLQIAARALLDEALLRLGLASVILWLVWRYHLGSRNLAAVVAVVGAALVQVMVYAPGVLNYGMRSDLAAMAYLGGAVLLPALVFGTLYMRRGFGTALVADASALATLAVLVAI